MQLEFHQLERRWEHLRVRHPARQRRLLASLAESGQQTPIVVVAAEGQADRYVVIDGYKRIVALEQLGRDTVEAVVWPMSEAAAVLLDRSLRLSEHETAVEMVLAIVNRAQRRLAGAAAAELDHQQSKAARHQIERIQNQLRRIGEEIQPEKKTHVEPSATQHDSGTEHAASEQARDRAGAGNLPRGRTQSPAVQLDRSTATAPSGESPATPATDPGAFREVQGESRASP